MGKFTAYKLPLKSLAVGTYEYEYRLDKQFFKDMESADIHNADITVKLNVEHKRDLYQLDFAITGTITLICDRCLDDLVMPVDTTYSIAVKYGEDYNDESDNLLVIPESDNYLNVAYMVYDTVALTIPMKHVHPMGKCNKQMSAMLRKHRAGGLADDDTEIDDTVIDEIESPYDNNAPTDPRWDELKKLNTPMGDD